MRNLILSIRTFSLIDIDSLLRRAKNKQLHNTFSKIAINQAIPSALPFDIRQKERGQIKIIHPLFIYA